MPADPITLPLGIKLTWEVGGSIAAGTIALGGSAYLIRHGYNKAKKLKTIDITRDKDRILFDCKVIEKFSYSISDVLMVEADGLAEMMFLVVARLTSGAPTPPLDVFRVAAIKAQQLAKDAISQNKSISEQVTQLASGAQHQV